MKLQILIGLVISITNVVSTRSPGRAMHPAGLIPRQAANATILADDTTVRRLLVGAAGKIAGFEFNGTEFTPSPGANISEPGKTASWMVFKEPNFLYAVDENSNATRLFNYDPTNGNLSNQVGSWNGSSGVVHLAFTSDKTRLIGSSYGQGQVDVWDSSAADGSLKLLYQIAITSDTNSTSQPRAHQAVLDPTGRFFVINDLGSDKLLVLDTAKDGFHITTAVPAQPAGCGPRHGAFISVDGGKEATHYLVVCETANTIQMFSVTYDDGLFMQCIQEISTFGPGLGPMNATSAAAGELLVSTAPGPAYVYVSNRNTMNVTDFITRFGLDVNSEDSTNPQLTFKGHIMTGGSTPRMFSFSKDSAQEYLFVGNMNGQVGLQAHKRCGGDQCRMSLNATAKYQNIDFFFAPELSGQGFGPQFVMQF